MWKEMREAGRERAEGAGLKEGEGEGSGAGWRK